MGTVFLLHFERPINPDRPCRHYLEYTARTVHQRILDHKSGNRWRSAAIPYAAYERGIGYVVARVWSNATKADEKRLRDLHANPALCPLCNPKLGLTTKRYERSYADRCLCFASGYDYCDCGNFERVSTYWRTFGPRDAYGNLASLQGRPFKKARPRIRRDGTPNGPNINDDPEARAEFLNEWREYDRAHSDRVVIDGKPYDIDVLNDTDFAF